MLKINDLQLDFDITSPADVTRYQQAGRRLEAESANLSYPAVSQDDPAFLDAYVDMLNGQLRLFGSFLDEVFGDGVAEKLLGGNPSLNKVTEVNDAIAKALADQGKSFGVKLQKYQPNRATRRSAT